MNRKRAFVALAIVFGIAGVVLGVDLWRRSQVVDVPPGSIPIYVNERLVGAFMASDLDTLEPASFVDAEEGKTQEGWLLRDVLRLYVDNSSLRPQTAIVVSSSSRGKTAELAWAQVDDPENYVMFDLANKGTIKLVSKMEGLSTRAQWVQDVDKVEVTTP